MARRPRPGRRFDYSLEPVLKFRGIKEQREKESFALKQREYLKEKDREDKIKEDRRDRQKELRSILKGRGKKFIQDFRKVMQRGTHLEVLKEELEEQIQRVLEATRRLEYQRDKLIKAMKDKKIIAKDKEKRFKEYRQLMDQLESNFLDEIATTRYKRKGLLAEA